MSFRCKNTDGTHQEVTWLFIKNAWLPAVSVCLQRLYSPVRAITVPTVRTDHVDTLYSSNATLDGTIVTQGTSNVQEYGFVWSIIGPPAVTDTPNDTAGKFIVGSESFTGAFEITTNAYSLPSEVTIYFRAYATNSSGTGYGATLSGFTFLCLAEGTLITLADGSQKSIEDIDYDDSLLVWNFDNATYDRANPVWMGSSFKMPKHHLVKVSDGSELRTVPGAGHRIFNLNKNEFTYMNEVPIGTQTFNDVIDFPFVVGHEDVSSETTFYNILTHTHLNVFANGILTSSGLNNIYPIVDMKFVKDGREARTIEEFEGVSEELFDGLRLAEQPTSYPELKAKITRIASVQLPNNSSER